MKNVCFIVLCLLPVFIIAQTNLSPGELVVLNTNSDGNDGFSFMSLVDLDAGTQIHFTDVGWRISTGAFKTTNDGGSSPLDVLGVYGVCTYTVPSGGLSAGVVVSQDKTNSNTNFSAYPGKGTFPYIATFSVSYGDQLIVFQGTFNSPVFIWALSYMNRTDDGYIHDWTTDGSGDASGSDDGNSDLPTGLTNGVNAILIPHTIASDYDNGWYSGATSAATAEGWRARVVNPSNWSYNDATGFTTHNGNIYTVTVPVVVLACITSTPTNVTTTTADLGGNVTDDGGATVTERGVVYSSSDNTPEIGEPGVTKNDNGSGIGTFSETITGLSSSTIYWFRAYATNSAGTTYGDTRQCTTLVEITFTNGADVGLNFVQSNATPQENNWLCGQFSLEADVTGSTLNSVTVTLGGTYDAGDLAATPFQIYAANSNDFASSSDLGSSVADPGSGSDVTFSGLSDALPASTRYYWVTADISSSATGDDTMNGTVDAAGDLSISTGTLSGSSSYGKLNADSDASLPVDLSSFSATCEGSSVVLNWTTESETNNLGFILERSLDNNIWTTISSYQTYDELKGRGNTSSATEYTFTDSEVEPEATYTYRLSDVNTDGKVNVYASLSITVDAPPIATDMEKAFPNPFNPQTYIAYHLAEDVYVNIAVYDIRGRQIKTLFSSQQLAGSYHVCWNATNNAGGKVPTGTYIIRMQAGTTQKIQKVMMIK